MRPCQDFIDCPPEGLLTNYSSEDLDLNLYNGIKYSADGCIGRCTSAVSQQEADLCAARQAVECVNTRLTPEDTLYGNDEQSCTVNCPNGSTFTYTVPASTFIARTLDEANAQALSYACIQANLQKFCFTAITQCCCKGEPFSATLDIEGDEQELTYSIASGSLPTGIAFEGEGMEATLEGTPTVAGNFSFTLRATNADGSHADRPLTLAVIDIADETSLPAFEVGVPYSHQMTAIGGSGNFAWRIVSGELPPGLTMTIDGLISGTPTGGTTGSLTFECIDRNCQQADQRFFPPRVSMATTSRTSIATIIGYPEFISPSTPPKRYKKLTWEGNSYQWGTVLTTGEFAGAARYEWTGTSEINSAGEQLSTYQKNFYAACPDATRWPQYLPNGNIFINVGTNRFTGYCWPDDPNSCPECSNPPAFVRDMSGNYVGDVSNFMRGSNATLVDQTHYQVHRAGTQPTAQWQGAWDEGANYVLGDSVSRGDFYFTALQSSGPDNGGSKDPDLEPEYWRMVAEFSFPGSISPVTNFADSTFNDVPNWIRLNASHWYEGLLEDEYTDEEALANARVFNSNGNTAENTPRTTGLVSRFTQVSFTIFASNLVAGSEYRITVTLFNTVTGVRTLREYDITATGTTETIIDSIPTPPAGQPVKVISPTIRYA